MSEPHIVERLDGAVTRLWLELPGAERHCGFGDPEAAHYDEMLAPRLGRSSERVTWLYTPMALPLAMKAGHSVLVYDVMDDLASFAHAPRELRDRQRDALQLADLVFTGGRSLQRGIEPLRADAHCFPSGVEPRHYEQARQRRAPRVRPVAGYVGVIDERLDLALVAGLAQHLPDWDIRIVGPIVKIDESELPQAPNLFYPGACKYENLPDVMGEFDVALMPFALNEATRSISPTKTLEYLAAGLPVVSTRIPDVVSDFGLLVDLQDDAAGFADACRRVLLHDCADRDRKLRPLLHANHWDTIAASMQDLIHEVSSSSLASAGRSA
ncbi:MAG TPA: glycosyltransferase [Acidimicrobiales bacterium]|nr:glycosyltransferase [Acidimicrobiales bacterium]